MSLFTKIKTLFDPSYDALTLPLADASLRPFFIISSGRSGTTLLRKRLMRHPELHIPPESDDLIPASARLFANRNNAGWEVLVEEVVKNFQHAECFRFWDIDLIGLPGKLSSIPPKARSYAALIDAVYRSHAAKHKSTATMWGDKTPYLMYELPWLGRIFPNAFYIHVVRDGRAVVHSMVSKQDYSLRTAAVRWRDSIRLFDRYKESLREDQFMEVRYEDLVTKTESTLRAICDSIGKPFNYKMLIEENFSMGDDILAHHSAVKESISTRHIEKWRAELSQPEIERLDRWLGRELKSRNYPSYAGV